MKFRFAPLPIRNLVRRVREPLPYPDRGNDKAHPSSRALRLVRKLPLPLIAAPERVVLNLCFVLIGIGSVVSQEPGSVITLWPDWLLYAFSLAATIGGGAVLTGMFRAKTSLERLGYLLVGGSSLLYAITVISARGWIGLPVFLIFTAIALSKTIRMIISSAERDMTIEFGEKLERDRDVS